MVFRSHRPIFGRIDHGTLSRIHSPDLSRSEEWDAQKGPNQREISMKPNALRWHFDRLSLHLRPHGVERFFASASTINFALEVNGNAVRHKFSQRRSFQVFPGLHFVCHVWSENKTARR